MPPLFIRLTAANILCSQLVMSWLDWVCESVGDRAPKLKRLWVDRWETSGDVAEHKLSGDLNKKTRNVIFSYKILRIEKKTRNEIFFLQNLKNFVFFKKWNKRRDGVWEAWRCRGDVAEMSRSCFQTPSRPSPGNPKRFLTFCVKKLKKKLKISILIFILLWNLR